MKRSTLTPDDELKQAILRAKNLYKESVQKAKLKYKFQTSTPEIAARMIDELIAKKKLEWAKQFFYGQIPQRRNQIALAMYGKAFSIKAHIQSGMYLSMSSLGMSKEHYNIVFYLRPQIDIRHNVDFSSKPSDELVLEIAKGYFPNIVQVDLV